MAGAAGELRGVSFISTENHEVPPTCLITSQRPHLPGLSHWVLEFNMNFGETTIQPVVYYLPSPPRDSKALERSGTTALVRWAPSEAADRQAALGGSRCHGAGKPAAGKETEAWLCAVPDLARM